jgi:hypothetical membrane protein
MRNDIRRFGLACDRRPKPEIRLPILAITTSTQRRLVILGALCWIAGLEFFAAEAIAAAGWPGYSYAEFDISFLGATNCAPFADPSSAEIAKDAGDLCSPRHAWMNAGLVLLGLLHLAGLAATWKAWPRGWATGLGLPALAAAACGAMLVGFAPVDGPVALHHAGAGVSLVTGNLGMLLMGLGLRERMPALAVFSFVAGVIGLAGLLGYQSHVDFGLGYGTTERAAAYPQTVWYAVLGVLILVGVLRAHRASV